MGCPSLHQTMTTLLHANNARGGYALSLICTEQGLPLAVAGDGPDVDVLAAFIALFDEVVARARRDLGLAGVDELTLLEGPARRLVVSPLGVSHEPRLYLVVQMDASRTWRRNTRLLRDALRSALRTEAEAGEGTDR